MKGRKPTPTAKKKLQGNPGKRPLNEREPRFMPSPLDPPAWLIDERAREEWAALAPALLAQGMLTVADRVGFGAYCMSVSRWLQAEAIVAKSPSMVFKTPAGYVQQMPHIGIAHRYLDQVRALAAEFGFTPASRSRLQVLGAPEGKDKHADFFGFGGSKANGKVQASRALH